MDVGTNKEWSPTESEGKFLMTLDWVTTGRWEVQAVSLLPESKEGLRYKILRSLEQLIIAVLRDWLPSLEVVSQARSIGYVLVIGFREQKVNSFLKSQYDTLALNLICWSFPSLKRESSMVKETRHSKPLLLKGFNQNRTGNWMRFCFHPKNFKPNVSAALSN